MSKLPKSVVWDKVLEGSTLIFLRYPNFLIIQYGICGMKPPCQNPARFVQSFRDNTGLAIIIQYGICASSLDLSRRYWVLLNCFRANQGHSAPCRKKWGLAATDICPCGKRQTMSHYCQQLSTDQAGGCSDGTQLMTLPLNA